MRWRAPRGCIGRNKEPFGGAVLLAPHAEPRLSSESSLRLAIHRDDRPPIGGSVYGGCGLEICGRDDRAWRPNRNHRARSATGKDRVHHVTAIARSEITDYVKLQLGSGVVIGRSFHYSE